jgi:hypothetical protein
MTSSPRVCRPRVQDADRAVSRRAAVVSACCAAGAEHLVERHRGCLRHAPRRTPGKGLLQPPPPTLHLGLARPREFESITPPPGPRLLTDESVKRGQYHVVRCKWPSSPTRSSRPTRPPPLGIGASGRNWTRDAMSYQRDDALRRQPLPRLSYSLRAGRVRRGRHFGGAAAHPLLLDAVELNGERVARRVIGH